VHRQHTVQVPEYYVRQQSIPHHAQLRRVVNFREVSHHLVDPAGLLLAVSNDGYPQRFLDLPPVLEVRIVVCPRGIRKDGDILGPEGVQRRLESEFRAGVQGVLVGGRERIIFVEDYSFDPAVITQGFVADV